MDDQDLAERMLQHTEEQLRANAGMTLGELVLNHIVPYVDARVGNVDARLRNIEENIPELLDGMEAATQDAEALLERAVILLVKAGNLLEDTPSPEQNRALAEYKDEYLRFAADVGAYRAAADAEEDSEPEAEPEEEPAQEDAATPKE